MIVQELDGFHVYAECTRFTIQNGMLKARSAWFAGRLRQNRRQGWFYVASPILTREGKV